MAAAEPIRRQCRAFFAGLSAGALPDGLLAADATFWTTVSGPMDPAAYRRVPAMLAAVFPDGLAFTIDGLVVEGDRAVAEVRSEGAFGEGEVYANTYVFVFGFADGRIASVAEHLNPLRVPPGLAARMQAALGG